MSAASHPPDDPREQMLRYLDGTLSAEDVSRFNELLQADTTLRWDFAELLLQQVQLTELGREARAAAMAAQEINELGDGTATQKSSNQRSADSLVRAKHSQREETADMAVRAPGSSHEISTLVIVATFVRWRIPLALAASVALLFSLGVWFFGPTMGEPVVAEVKGADVTIERGTEIVSARAGTALQPGDVLRTGVGTVVTMGFGAEKTRIDLSESSELKLASLDSGKRFHLSSGKLEADVARQRPFKPMIVSTPNAQARVIGTQFTLTATTNRTQLDVAEGKVRLSDTSNDKAVQVPAGHYAVVAAATELAALPQTGWIYREYWTNLPGKDVQLDMLTRSTLRPSGEDWLNTFETPKGGAGNYSACWRGFLHPPVTGTYGLAVAGTAYSAILFLSRDDQPENKVSVIAGADLLPPSWTPAQKPRLASFTLQAGRRYYVEVIHKVGQGTDRLAVAWKRPDGRLEIIPGEYLSPFKPKPKEEKP